MPVAAEHNTRSGANTFLNFAMAMCRIVNASAPIIQARYADRPALLAVLTAAQGVCALLPAAMDEKVTMDSVGFDFAIGDADVIPGQDAG